MSAVPTNKKRERQTANQAPARHSGEGRNPPASSFRTPRSGDPESSVLLVEREALDVNAVREASTADGVRKNWRVLPLGEVVEILDSRRVPVNSAERAKRVGNVPYYGATGQVGVIDKHIFDEELVLLGEDGAPFLDAAKPKAYIIRGKSWVNNHAHVLRGKLGLLNSFLLCQLNSIDYRPFVSGTTRLKLPQGPMKRIPLLVPPENEQRQIVAEIEKQFTRLDAGMAALSRVQANLKRYRAAVLKAACEGRLVPTEAELARAEGRTCETGEQLLARILADRRKNWHGRGKYKEPAAADATNLPPIPEGWAWTRLEQLGVTYGGLTKHPKRAKLPNQLPYLRVANVYANELRLSDIEYIGVAESELEKLLVRVGDLLIVEGNGSKDQIGRLAIWNGSIDPCVHQNHLIKVRLVNPVMPKWILYWLQSTGGRRFVELVASSTSGLYTLSVNKIGDLPILLPPLTEQTRIVAKVERCLSVIEELEAAVAANLQRATRLRQSILKRAFERVSRAVQ